MWMCDECGIWSIHSLWRPQHQRRLCGKCKETALTFNSAEEVFEHYSVKPDEPEHVTVILPRPTVGPK